MRPRDVLAGILVVAAVVAVGVVGAAIAGDEAYSDKAWDEGEEGEKDEYIDYPGVDPTKSGGIPPLIKKAKQSKKTVVTWPGFQMVHGGGSRVFVQMLKGTNVSVVDPPVRVAKHPFKIEGPHIVYRFSKKIVLIKNNLNPLITRSFDTPVNTVKVTRKKKQVYMILYLRQDVEPVREELVSTEDGYHFYFVEFPSGDYLPEKKKKAKSKGQGKSIIE